MRNADLLILDNQYKTREVLLIEHKHGTVWNTSAFLSKAGATLPDFLALVNLVTLPDTNTWGNYSKSVNVPQEMPDTDFFHQCRSDGKPGHTTQLHQPRAESEEKFWHCNPGFSFLVLPIFHMTIKQNLAACEYECVCVHECMHTVTRTPTCISISLFDGKWWFIYTCVWQEAYKGREDVPGSLESWPALNWWHTNTLSSSFSREPRLFII